MSTTIKIIIVDIASGHTVSTLYREFEGSTATDAAEEVRDAIDTYVDCEDAED